MNERKKAAVNKKMYHSKYSENSIEKISMRCGIVSTICFLLFTFVFENEYLGCFFEILCLYSWFYWITGFVLTLYSGYAVQDDGFFFTYRFMKNKLLYKEINCIIISNSQSYRFNAPILKTPYVTVIGGEQEKILQFCINSKKRHVLTNKNIRYVLGAEIGYYHLENIREMFKKGSSTIYDYGFMWNEGEMYKIFQGYQGDYYIAASVLENFRDRFDDIVQKYDISDNRIHIIDDSTDGKFIWRY